MYNNGNSSKNVTGSSVVDGTLVTADIADDAVTADKLANSINTDIATGVTANTTASAALPKAGGTITGNLISEATNTFGKSTSAVTTTVKSSVNWNYPEFKVQRNSSNTANFKAISFMLDGDSDSNTDLYGYPSIIINTDTAPTTGDTSAAENASMTINAPSTIRFGTGSAERMRILSSGGITFNGDTAAANALDDYEEGTFTPALGDCTASFSYNTGKYQKIGNMVTIHIGFKLSSVSSLGTGTARITGLPFSAVNFGGYQEPHLHALNGYMGSSFPSLSFLVSGTYLYARNSGTNADTAIATNALWTSSSFIKFQLTYWAP